MDAEIVAPAAPAQPATPPSAPARPAPATAKEAAVTTSNFGDYRRAKRAEESGKPLPAPSATPAAAAAPGQPADPALSKRQQQLNDRIRAAVDQARSGDQAEIARLRRELESRSPAAPAQPATPADPKASAAPAQPADHERYLSHPDAPKLENFSDYDKWSAAMAVFVTDQRHSERDQAAQTRAKTEAQQRQQHERKEKFSTSLKEAVTADPTFLETLSPEVLNLKPFDALVDGEKGGPLNVVAEELIDSPAAAQIMRHLSQHPEELQAIAQMTSVREVNRAFSRLEARFAGSASPAPINTEPAAPPPPRTVGSRPAQPVDAKAAAVKRGDFAAYRAAKRLERHAAK